MFTGFYKKTRQERIDILKNTNKITEKDAQILSENKTLDVEVAGKMAENHIGTFSLPFSVVPSVLINDKEYTIPMVTEEPSVVAACSNASKIINKSGGFYANVHDRKMIGQVSLYDIEDIKKAEEKIKYNYNKLIKIANEAHPSIVKRGGGVTNISQKILIENDIKFLVVYITVDVKEAMGANILNNMLEALKPVLENISKGKSLMAILSNYATNSLVTATCSINIDTLHKDISEAKKIAYKIDLASKFAKVDPYRAATHNKGIFNGIDSVVIATGNDWRAIEASCHTYATKNGRYEGLSTWKYAKEEQKLLGELTLPLPIATVGGSIGLNETVRVAHNILNNPKAKKLSEIIASVGLAQNFAALKALVSVGIQQGHMKLQAKSLALIVGAINEEVDEVAKELNRSKHINLETAKKILKNIRENK